VSVTSTLKEKIKRFSCEKMMFGKVKKLYFVGIGGAGMSGIAEILFNLGYHIEGSDHSPTEITEYLKSLGVNIYSEHRAENLMDTSGYFFRRWRG